MPASHSLFSGHKARISGEPVDALVLVTHEAATSDSLLTCITSRAFSLSSILRAFPHRQESRSRDASVLLVNMTSESSGRYTCEVSVEPTFETTSQSATLVVGDDSSCASESLSRASP